MKQTIELDENDIIALITEKYGAVSVSLRIHEAIDDGHCRHSPARVTAQAVVSNERPVIAQQTVVMGDAAFGSTHIVMSTRKP